MTLEVLSILIFVVTTGLVYGAYVLVSGRSQSAAQKAMQDRLQEAAGFVLPEEGSTPSLLRVVAEGPMPNVDRVARAALKGSALELWLEQSGTGMTPSGYVLISFALGVMGVVAAMALGGRPWTLALGFVAGILAPPAYLRRRRTSRMNKFEEHFPEALDLVSRAIRAGHAFSAGMKMVADEMSDPVGPEFRKAFDEQNFGLPLKESLNNLAARMPLLDVRFFATAILIQRDTGGNLSEILDNLAGVVRERFKIRRQVRVHTAHGRFTGYVLLALPAFLALALSFINPEHMKVLFEDRMGQMMIVASILMQAAGFFWIKQIVKIEV